MALRRLFPTVIGNTASNVGGGIANSSTMTLTNSTVTSNSAVRGGGIYNPGAGDLNNTIIAANNATSADPDCSGTLTSKGHNLVQDTSGCTITGDLTGNITGQDPLLGPLQNNGGPTLTHALLPGSPAIDAGDDSGPGRSPQPDHRPARSRLPPPPGRPCGHWGV